MAREQNFQHYPGSQLGIFNSTEPSLLYRFIGMQTLLNFDTFVSS